MKEDILFITEDQVLDMSAAQAEAVVDSQKFLIFVTDDLKLGVDAGFVVEIITNHVITYLPMVPSYVKGIINLRGQIIPILDVRERLGKPSKEDSLVVVLNIDGTQIGILVDSVDQMVDVPRESILPVPARSAQKLVSGMCTLPGGTDTMMVLDCAQLLTND